MVHHKAIEKICAKRYTTPKLLSQNGYNQIKVRVYKTHSEQQKENKIKELQKLMELRRKLKQFYYSLKCGNVYKDILIIVLYFKMEFLQFPYAKNFILKFNYLLFVCKNHFEFYFKK